MSGPDETLLAAPGTTGLARPRAIVFAAGDMPQASLLAGLLEGVDLVVAADGGLAHAAALALTPQRIVGDLDSVDPDLLASYRDVPVQTHRVDKDELDLELALLAARELGAASFRVLGAFGGRLDHTLAAMLVGARWSEAGFPLSLHGGSHEAWLCTPHHDVELQLPRGTTVSLLALREAAVLESRGLRFELAETRLEFGVGLGLSNVVEEETIRVVCASGVAALIVEHRV